MGLLTEVTMLNLGQNSLTGTAPTQLGCLTKLTTGGPYGFLQSNLLSGTLPSELGYYVQMNSELTLHNNKFDGTLPTGWCFETGVATAYASPIFSLIAFHFAAQNSGI